MIDFKQIGLTRCARHRMARARPIESGTEFMTPAHVGFMAPCFRDETARSGFWMLAPEVDRADGTT